MPSIPFRNTIGAKLLAAFLVMTGLIATLGGYSFWLLSASGDLVVHTYDKPLMAINFARAASLDFALMQNDVLKQKLAPPAERVTIADHLRMQTETFFEDLDVARERSSANDEIAEIATIRKDVKHWVDFHENAGAVARDADLRALDKDILAHFDMLVELNADHSFIDRRKAVWSIARYKYAIGIATGVALLLTFAVAFLLSRRVAKPLTAATGVAQRIGAGDLETAIPDGGGGEAGLLLKTMGSMRDNIRSRVEQEKTLRALAEIRLIDALESASEGVLLSDSGGAVVVANGQLGAFFPNTEPRKLMASTYQGVLDLIESEFLPDPDGADLRVTFGCLAAGANGSTLERQLRDGRWLRINAGRTRDGGNLLVFSDFSQIMEREQSLKLAKKAAEAASAAKTRFLTNMSHELRTPLNAIIGFSELIAGEMFGKIPDHRYVDYAGDILSSGRHLLEVINSVLDIARTEAGKPTLDIAVVDLREIVSHSVAITRGQAESAGLALEWEEPQDAMPISGDATKLRQIAINIMSNAVKFTGTGGRVSVTCARRNGQIELAIADTGIGMTAEDIDVALTPFGQVDNRLERKYEGTGLGLPIAKSFVEAHGGCFEVSSERGVGTTIRMCFPATQAPAALTA